MSAEDLIKERGKTHGDFFDVACNHIKIRQCLIRGPVNPDQLIHPVDGLTLKQIEALDMIALKLARIISGGHRHKDSWDDIAGYATLGGRDAV